jgi:hypothetical protein
MRYLFFYFFICLLPASYAQNSDLFNDVSHKLKTDTSCFKSFNDFTILCYLDYHQLNKTNSMDLITFDYYLSRYNACETFFRLVDYDALIRNIRKCLDELGIDRHNSMAEVLQILDKNKKNIRNCYIEIISKEENFISSEELKFEYYESYLKIGKINCPHD